MTNITPEQLKALAERFDKSHYLGEFKPDIRAINLHDRLQQYYNETPDSMNNKYALPKWHEFRRWCNDNDYTQEEINRAKMQKFDFDSRSNSNGGR